MSSYPVLDGLWIAQLNPVVADIIGNGEKIRAAIQKAIDGNAKILVFSELITCGYPARDWLLDSTMVTQCLALNQQLITETAQHSVLIIWGSIDRNPGQTGNALFNCAFAAQNGRLIAQSKKAHLPTYDIFDEARYFESGTPDEALTIFQFGESRIALCICEDLWGHSAIAHYNDEIEAVAPHHYDTDIFAGFSKQKADLIVNLSASPYQAGKPASRRQLVQAIAKAEQLPVLYVNQVGATDDLIYDGNSFLTLPDESQRLFNGFEAVVLSVLAGKAHAPEVFPEEKGLEELHQALILGIRDYFRKTGFNHAFIGLSGGIDSALTAALAVEALGAENVTGIAMPGPYSSKHSVSDAEQLAHALKLDYRIHSIQALFESGLETLSSGISKADLAEQNLQSRLRGIILMSLANRENGLVLATGNKSEIAMGYSTLYGDSCGALAPLGDLYKTQVYGLSRWINQSAGKELIPASTLDKPPSAELSPNQLDSDSLPPYEVLDEVLKAIIETQQTFVDLKRLGYDGSTLRLVFKRLFANEFKRQQLPPALKVSQKAFGTGRFFPLAHGMDSIAGS